MKLPTEAQIKDALAGVKDPELFMDIVSLGLIYEIRTSEDGIDILMTLTTPFCPFGDKIVQDVEKALKPFGCEARVDITFEPEWVPPEDLKIALGLS